MQHFIQALVARASPLPQLTRACPISPVARAYSPSQVVRACPLFQIARACPLFQSARACPLFKLLEPVLYLVQSSPLLLYNLALLLQIGHYYRSMWTFVQQRTQQKYPLAVLPPIMT